MCNESSSCDDVHTTGTTWIWDIRSIHLVGVIVYVPSGVCVCESNSRETKLVIFDA